MDSRQDEYSPLDFLVPSPRLLTVAERTYGSFVYVIQCGEAGPVKIGAAAKPSKRLEIMQTGCPYELTIGAVITCGSRHNIERTAHAIAKEHRIRGEWFDMSVLEAVEAILIAARTLKARHRPAWETFDDWYIDRKPLT